jgi:DNA-binding MarR family transcriptional regulator
MNLFAETLVQFVLGVVWWVVLFPGALAGCRADHLREILRRTSPDLRIPLNPRRLMRPDLLEKSNRFLDRAELCVYTHTMSSTPLDFCAMENCVCFNLRSTSRAMTQFFGSKLSRHRLLPTQTPILSILAARPGATMAELSEWLRMERTTLVRNLGPLERDGLVKLSGKGRGGKVTVEITPKGKSALAKLMPEWQATQQAVVKTLGEERWSAILRDLRRAAQALEE